jgi:hypothetical protein
MKLTHLTIATATVALLGGAAYAQQPQPPAAPTPGSVTGDWNGAHAPSDDKQYQEKVRVPVGEPAASTADTSTSSSASGSTDATVSATSTTAPAAATAGADVSTTASATFTNMTVTNGPVPDTRENRAKYGQPMSRAGKRTAARGN